MKMKQRLKMPVTTSETGKTGFTLIELLIVISIIIILISLITSAVNTAKIEAFRKNSEARCAIIKNAILTYWNDCKQLPDSDVIMPSSRKGAWVAQLAVGGKNPPYLDSLGDNLSIEIPQSTGSLATGKVLDDWGFEIRYRVVGQFNGSESTKRQDQKRAAAITRQAFFVWSLGENGTDDFTDAYDDWNLNVFSEDWKTYEKLIDPMDFALEKQIDDVIVGN